MNDQTARWIGIILAIVATAVVNRILSDKKIQALEDNLVSYFKAELAMLGVPQAETEKAIETVMNGKDIPPAQPPAPPDAKQG